MQSISLCFCAESEHGLTSKTRLRLPRGFHRCCPTWQIVDRDEEVMVVVLNQTDSESLAIAKALLAYGLMPEGVLFSYGLLAACSSHTSKMTVSSLLFRLPS